MFVGEFNLDSPFMNAGGLVKGLEDARRMAATAVGAVVAGSFTIDEKVGNSPNGEIVYYHDPQTMITYNALGMPNKGLRSLAATGELQDMIDVTHDAGKPFILNFAPISEDPFAEVTELRAILARAKIENLDGLELNASCPNVVTADGGRHELLSHHTAQLGDVLYELDNISWNEVPFGFLAVRISPFRRKEDALELATVIDEAQTDAVSAFNTFPGGIPVNQAGAQILQVSGGMGGQSGLGMMDKAEEQTRWLDDARTQANGVFEIIGSNGVGNGKAMRRRMKNFGVSAVSATTLFWESNSWGEAANKILEEYVEALETA